MPWDSSISEGQQSQGLALSLAAVLDVITNEEHEDYSSTGFNVYVDTQIAPAGWVLQNTTPIVTTINNYTITNLIASTGYKIKVQDAGIGAGCKPIEILVSTIA